MGASSPPHRIDHYFLIIFLTFVVMELCICSEINNTGVCRKEEKQALLCFKEESKVSTNWVDGTNCCDKWEGVLCDNVTGHIIELSLAGYVEFVDYRPPKGKLSSCLLELKQLRHLDLSGFSEAAFNGSRIPSFIGSFVNLQYLDLSYSGFQGIIPHQLGNLSSLHTLRLPNSGLKVDKLDWLSSLSNLELLDLDFVNLSVTHNWAEVINMLPYLRELHLSSCGLPKPSHPLHLNTSLLVFLDLSNNKFNTVISRWVFNLNNLVYLGLSSSGFVGPFFNASWNMSSLRFLDISSNELNGSLPSQLFGVSHLEYLYISSNQFQGLIGHWNLMTSLKTIEASNNPLNSNIPNWIYNCNKLETLDLSNTHMQGTISNSISNLTSLSTLNLCGNNLTGQIPKQIGKLSKLESLDLSENKFYGPLPKSLGDLVSLRYLTIYNNMLEGIVTKNHFLNLTMLRELRASGNRLTLNVSPKWMPPFQLRQIALSGWNLGPQFPAWLRYLHNVETVDISNTGITSEVPTWFWNLSSSIAILNISHNQMRGKIEEIPIQQLNGCPWLLVYLGSNQFSGPLPRISINITELDLSNNSFSGDISHFLCNAQNVTNKLKILHLGGNALSGEIPDCWMHWPHLNVINMEENKVIGSIPNSLGLLSRLRSLDLHKNMFSGHIPPSLQNCIGLLKVDLGENGFTGNIPTWLGLKLSNLTILRLRINKFNGELPPEFCHLKSLQILDLADNNLVGVIPRCVENLTAMIHETREIQDGDYEMNYSNLMGVFQESALVTTKWHEYNYGVTILLMLATMDLSGNNFSGEIPIELTNLVGLRSLNLSRNDLIGIIPLEMGNMKLLESLDLSRNQLSGEIPSSFSSLSTLGVLDLSYNNLSGRIPSGTQLQGFNASCYIGNNLCGLPVSKNCSVGDGEIPKHESKDDDSEVDWFYVSMAIGFAVGFWVTCGSLLLVRPWRIAYFQFLDNKLNHFLAWARVLWV